MRLPEEAIRECQDLSSKHYSRLRKIFEPKYGRELTDEEIREIHYNLKTVAFVAAKAVINNHIFSESDEE